MTSFGRELVESADEALAIARGERAPTRQARPSDAVDVAAIRRKLGLSQAGFSKRFRFSPATIRDWEQGRRQPDGPARTLLRVIEHAPEVVEQAIQVDHPPA